MYLAKISFGSPKYDSSNREKITDTVESYFASMMKTGQVCGSYSYAWRNNILTVYANLARPDSFKLKYHSKWGKKGLSTVKALFNQPPLWEIIEDINLKRFPSWKSANGLYMFTKWCSEESPIYRLNDKSLIPSYLLPLSDAEREDLYSWQQEYNDHDSIWLGSGKLELPAYKELADPRSELSQNGRDLCKIIENKTDKKTYYYLMRYYGRNKDEKDRLCPLCGKHWLIEENLPEELPFNKFPFKCEKCRLVSHLAFSYENERYAHIGEYPKSRRKNKNP